MILENKRNSIRHEISAGLASSFVMLAFANKASIAAAFAASRRSASSASSSLTSLSMITPFFGCDGCCCFRICASTSASFFVARLSVVRTDFLCGAGSSWPASSRLSYSARA